MQNSMPSSQEVKAKRNPNNPLDLFQSLSELEASRRYKALDDNAKAETRSRVFDKYVLPFYAKRGIEPPSKEHWITGQFSSSDTEPFKHPMAKMYESDFFQTFGMAGAKGFLEWGEALRELNNRYNYHASYQGKTIHEKLQEKVDNWYIDNYNNDIAHKLGDILGRSSSDIPLYMAAGEITGAMKIPKFINSPYGKFLYRRLVSSTEGYLIAKGKGEENPLDTAKSFAIMGTAGEAIGAGFGAGLKVAGATTKYIRELLGIGGPRLVNEVIAHAASETAPGVAAETQRLAGLPKPLANPLADRIKQASREVLNDFAKAHYNGKLFHFLPQADKAKVLDAIAEETAKQARTVSTVDPKVAQSVIKADFTKQMQQNPALQQSMKLLGLQPDEVFKTTAEAVVERAGAKNGSSKVPAVMERLARGATKEGDKANAIALRVGAASVNSPEFLPNLLKMVETNFKLENPKHKLVFLWSIKDEFPKQVQNIIKQHMETEFPGMNARSYNNMAAKLDEHLSDLQTTGKLGERVFRSTNLGKAKTEWQKDLQDTADIMRVGKIVRNAPTQAQQATKDVAKRILRSKNYIKEAQ